jgi:hypothetical protein
MKNYEKTEIILTNHFIYNLKLTIVFLLNKYARNQNTLESGVNLMIDMLLSSVWLINGILLLIAFMESRMSKKQVSSILIGFIIILLLMMKRRV